MKTRNITLALTEDLLRRLKLIAAARDSGNSALLTAALRQIADQEQDYEQARRGMLADLSQGYNRAPSERSAGPGSPSMNRKEFVDTIVLVYAFDRSAGA